MPAGTAIVIILSVVTTRTIIALDLLVMPIERPKTCAKTNDDDDDDDDKVAKRTKHVMRKQVMILRGIEMLSSPVLQQMKLLDAVMVAIGVCATLLQLVSISGRRAFVVKGDRHSRAVQSRGIDTEESASCQGAKKGSSAACFRPLRRLKSLLKTQNQY